MTAPCLRKTYFDRIAAPKTLSILETAGHCLIETPGIHQLADVLTDVHDRVTASACES